MGESVATKNKKVRQQALREQLSAQGHVQHVIDLSEKLSTEYLSLESSQITALKSAAEIKLRLINKYLPDLKSVEHVGDAENPIEHRHALFEFNPVGRDD